MRPLAEDGAAAADVYTGPVDVDAVGGCPSPSPPATSASASASASAMSDPSGGAPPSPSPRPPSPGGTGDADATPQVANRRRPPPARRTIKAAALATRMLFSPPKRLSRGWRQRGGGGGGGRGAGEDEDGGRPGGGGSGHPSVPEESPPPSVRSAYVGPTDLHQICHDATSAAALEAAPVGSLGGADCCVRDADGRNPMHLLARNLDLVRSASAEGGKTDAEDAASVTKFASHFLLPSHPLAVLEEDDGGEVPFERALVRWIVGAHEEGFGGLRRGESGASLGGPGVFDLNFDFDQPAQLVQSAVHASLSASRAALAWGGRSIHHLSALPRRAGGEGEGEGEGEPPPDAARYPVGSDPWTIRESASLDTIETAPSPQQLSSTDADEDEADVERGAEGTKGQEGRGRDEPGRRRQSLFRPGSKAQLVRRLPTQHMERLFPMHVRLSSHATQTLLILSAIVERLEDDAREETRISLRSLDSASPSSDVRRRLIERVASIPNLIKTLLLIEDESERSSVFGLSIVRGVMLSGRSMGPWFTWMLRSENGLVSKRAVQYLGLLSDVSDESEKNRQWSGGDQEGQAATKHDEVQEAVLVLDDLIPSLLGLSNAAVEQAATTPIIRRVLDSMITKPFAVSVIFFDGIFLLLLIWSFRKSSDGYVEGDAPEDIILWIYIANANIFYFLVRELGKGVSLGTIGGGAFLTRFFWGFWSVVDIISIVFSLGSTIFMRVEFTGDMSLGKESHPLRWCLAVTTGELSNLPDIMLDGMESFVREYNDVPRIVAHVDQSIVPHSSISCMLFIHRRALDKSLGISQDN